MENSKKNTLFGVFGGILFSIIGGALWYLFYQIGLIAGLSVIFGLPLTILGYRLFCRQKNLKSVLISVFITLFSIVIAWYLCLCCDVYTIHNHWYNSGEISYSLSFFEAVKSAGIYLTEPKVGVYYWRDLGVGAVLCLIVSIFPISLALEKK